MNPAKTINRLLERFEHQTRSTKLALVGVLVIFAAIPVTVFAVYGVRSLTPQAATGKPSSLTPAYSTYSTTPTFSWNCYCYTTKYRVYLREGDGNFYAGSWYKEVFGTSGKNSTIFGGWINNNYKSAPASLTAGKTYYWAVSCVTGGCKTSATQAFTVLTKDTSPPEVSMGTTLTKPTSLTFYWSTYDNVGVVRQDISLGVTTETSTGIIPLGSGITSYTYNNLTPNTLYYYNIRAYDAAGNVGGRSGGIRTDDIDSDGDGWLNGVEIWMGTNPNLKCGGASAWPPDLNGDKVVSSADQFLLYKAIASPPANIRRYEFYPGDNVLNSKDSEALAKYVGQRCQ